jgi:hypothetical protein
MTIRWHVDGDEAVPLGPGHAKEAGEGTYQAFWEVPRAAGPGAYRFVVTAKRYRLVSRDFDVRRAAVLSAEPVRARRGRAAFTLAYPRARPYDDLTYRPSVAPGGWARVHVNGRARVVRARWDGRFVVAAPAGSTVVVRAGAARDRYGNVNAQRMTFTAGEPSAPRPREPYPVLR